MSVGQFIGLTLAIMLGLFFSQVLSLLLNATVRYWSLRKLQKQFNERLGDEGWDLQEVPEGEELSQEEFERNLEEALNTAREMGGE